MTSNSENYIAIGYSENSSEQLAKQDACNSARRELIGYVFGAAYQINQNMVRSLGVLDYSQDVSSSSGEIIIRGAVTETSQSHGTTKCSISYPSQEAVIEKERLKSASNFKSTQFTEVGDATQAKGGVIEILTIPEDASVFIDNERWGVTPLRLNGKLSVGSHRIRIEHENYKTVEISEEIGSSGKRHIEQILKRATGKLRILTDPEGATIMIDGQSIGQSPTDFIEIISGHKAKIEIAHPEADSLIQTVSLAREEERTLNIPLQLKTSAFSIHAKPKGATIRLDGSVFVSSDQWVSIGPGRHNLVVTKDGYEDFGTNFDLRGGEKKTLPSVQLVSISIENERHLKNGPAWMTGIYLGESQTPLSGVDPAVNQFGLQARYQIFHMFAVELIGTYNAGTANYSDTTLNLTGYQVTFGIPIRLYQSQGHALINRLSIAPTATSINNTYAASYKTSRSSPSVTYSQMGFGTAVIWSLFTPTEYRQTGYFMDFRIGETKYQDAQQLQGALPINIGLSAGITW